MTVKQEYSSELSALRLGNRVNIDPFVYDLYNAVSLVEQYGEYLEELIWISESVDEYNGNTIEIPGRFDMCECQNLVKCPNGTVSSTGSNSLTDCTPELVQVLRRISVIPSYFNANYSPPATSGNLKLSNISDFWEISGADYSLPNGPQSYKIGTINVEAFDVAVITLDFTSIHYNITYGVDFRVSIYVDCKPCPSQYYCDYSQQPATCKYPSVAEQNLRFNECKNR